MFPDLSTTLQAIFRWFHTSLASPDRALTSSPLNLPFPAALARAQAPVTPARLRPCHLPLGAL